MAIDPVCQMEVNEHTTQFTAEYQGTTYYFCAMLCNRLFQEHPEQYVHRSQYWKTDPVCGMEIRKETPSQYTSTYQGSTYHFCSALCKQQFDRQPAQFAGK